VADTGSEQVRELFVLTKPERSPVRCTVLVHQRGCELRLFVGPVFLKSQRLPDREEAAAIAETWRMDLMALGWGPQD
jgi:hypothetical protein